MATLSDLKTRIADELTRDDMGSGGEAEGALNRAIDSAIEFYADELFWFNRDTGTRATTAGVDYVALPTSMRRAEQVSYLQQPLIKVDLREIEDLTDSGQPSRWAENGDNIQLWPVPDAAYTLAISGVAELGTPVTSNAWTTDGYDLIAARVKVILCRFPFRDTEGLAMAQQEEAQVLGKLLRESRKRRQHKLRPDLEGDTRYNISTDR